MTIHRTTSDTSDARSGLALWPIILAFWFASAATAGTVVYEDSTFNDADWSMRLLVSGFSDPQLPTDRQVSSGGNPGAYREINLKFDSTFIETWMFFGLYSKAGATYEPSTQGAIEAIHYSEDAIIDVSSSGQEIGLSIIQQPFGRIYVALASVIETNWTHKSLPNLKANDFVEISGGILDLNSHPDFSASGGDMAFGYVRGLESYSAIRRNLDLRGGIDNWRVEVETTGNDAPVADAGPDQRPIYSGGQETLDGSGSYDPVPGPNPLTFSWTQISGPHVDITVSGSKATIITRKQRADYAFQLVVSDGQTVSQPSTVRVLPEANPPLDECERKCETHTCTFSKGWCLDSCYKEQSTSNFAAKASKSVAKAGLPTDPISLARTYRGVRDKLLAATPEGQRFARLYQEHTTEMLALISGNREMVSKLSQMLSTLQPLFDDLLADQGAAAVITAEHTQAIESFLDYLAAEGSPALRDAIAAERTHWGPLKNYEGQSMAEAQNKLLGHGVFLPRLTNP